VSYNGGSCQWLPDNLRLDAGLRIAGTTCARYGGRHWIRFPYRTSDVVRGAS